MKVCLKWQWGSLQRNDGTRLQPSSPGKASPVVAITWRKEAPWCVYAPIRNARVTQGSEDSRLDLVKYRSWISWFKALQFASATDCEKHAFRHTCATFTYIHTFKQYCVNALGYLGAPLKLAVYRVKHEWMCVYIVEHACLFQAIAHKEFGAKRETIIPNRFYCNSHAKNTYQAGATRASYLALALAHCSMCFAIVAFLRSMAFAALMYCSSVPWNANFPQAQQASTAS